MAVDICVDGHCLYLYDKFENILISGADMSAETDTAEKSLYDKFLDGIAYVCTVVTGVGLVVLTVIFGWLVYGRYVLNATPTWVEQVSLLLIVMIAFLGASVGIHRNTHLGVSFFREIAPRPVRRVFEFITHITLIVFGGAMAFYSYKLVLFKWTTLIRSRHGLLQYL